MCTETIEGIVLIEDRDGKVEDVVVIEDILSDKQSEHDAEISVELLSDPEHRRHHFRAALDSPLLHILDEGARKFDKKLLPSPDAPLDHLKGVYEHHEFGPPLNLDLTLHEFLDQHPVTHHFAIDLVLAIQVNARWRVAMAEEMTPKAILELFGLSWEQFTLYKPGATVPLPLDTPIKLERGDCFEAQKDGQYGDQ